MSLSYYVIGYWVLSIGYWVIMIFVMLLCYWVLSLLYWVLSYYVVMSCFWWPTTTAPNTNFCVCQSVWCRDTSHVTRAHLALRKPPTPFVRALRPFSLSLSNVGGTIVSNPSRCGTTQRSNGKNTRATCKNDAETGRPRSLLARPTCSNLIDAALDWIPLSPRHRRPTRATSLGRSLKCAL